MSTIAGGNPIKDDDDAAPSEDMPGSESERVAEGGGAITYVVVAGEDGAVRFYDLKFRLEVRRHRRLLAVIASDVVP